MSFCGNCGAQLQNEDLFCGRCGMRLCPEQNELDLDSFDQNEKTTIAVSTQEKIKGIPEIKGWVVAIVVVLCSPLCSAILVGNLLYILPEFLMWLIFFGMQIVAMFLLWSKKNWKIWIKALITTIYVLLYFI